MKKIVSLTSVFIKEFYQSLPIFDKTKNKFDKKSIFFWMFAIILIAIAYVSYEIISFLVDNGQPEIFLNIYFPIILIILSFQSILVCGNVFFFSKDIKNVLHFPIKPKELLISKFLTLLSMLYIAEGLFAVIPFTLYGLMAHVNLLYFIWEILVLICFPILIELLVIISMLIIMRFGKFVKNKDILQFIITIFLLLIVFSLEFNTLQGLFNINSTISSTEQFDNFYDRAEEVNKYFLIVNPSINVLSNPNSIQAIISFFEILLYNIIAFILFIILGKVTYLKDVLYNSTNYTKIKHKKVNIEKDIKTHNIAKSYIIKEFKILFKEPAFFLQCVFPVIIIIITCLMLILVFSPIITEIMRDETIINTLNEITFNAEILCYILIVMQVLFSLSNISLTAISREGRNALLVKYLPVCFYKQFLYKNIPQILLNTIILLSVLAILYYYLPILNLVYVFGILLISFIINCLNSYLMVIADLRRPNLHWESEYAVVKKNNNKIFQYVLMIVNILVLMYIAKVLEEVNILLVLGIEFLIYLMIFIVVDRCVKKWQYKLFNKIN